MIVLRTNLHTGDPDKRMEQIVKSRIGPQAMTSMHIHFEDYDSTRVMVVRCKKSPIPVFVKDGETERFYVRTGPSTTELTASQTQEYIRIRFRL